MSNKEKIKAYHMKVIASGFPPMGNGLIDPNQVFEAEAIWHGTSERDAAQSAIQDLVSSGCVWVRVTACNLDVGVTIESDALLAIMMLHMHGVEP